ncbi:MAG: hypothetical protein J6Q85_02840 [Clostridia bacterium]|nr:hypothetical protein [Clostridia bacterium]
MLTPSVLSSCNFFVGNETPSDGSSDVGGEDDKLPGDNDQPGNNDQPGDNEDDKDDGEDDSDLIGSPSIGNDALTTLCVLSSPSAQITAENSIDAITLSLTDTSDSYQVVRVPVDPSWDTVKITQGKTTKYAKSYLKDGVRIVDFYMVPNSENAVVTPEIKTNDKNLKANLV